VNGQKKKKSDTNLFKENAVGITLGAKKKWFHFCPPMKVVCELTPSSGCPVEVSESLQNIQGCTLSGSCVVGRGTEKESNELLGLTS
jgi:hypothetical protein